MRRFVRGRPLIAVEGGVVEGPERGPARAPGSELRSVLIPTVASPQFPVASGKNGTPFTGPPAHDFSHQPVEDPHFDNLRRSYWSNEMNLLPTE